MVVSCTPGVVSSVSVSTGRRRLLRSTSPGTGVSLRMLGRVCSIDMNSCRARALKAQKSTTWWPCVLITRMLRPRGTRTATPRPAGIDCGSPPPRFLAAMVRRSVVRGGTHATPARDGAITDARGRPLVRRCGTRRSPALVPGWSSKRLAWPERPAAARRGAVSNAGHGRRAARAAGTTLRPAPPSRRRPPPSRAPAPRAATRRCRGTPRRRPGSPARR